MFAYEPEPHNSSLLERNIRELNSEFAEGKYELYCKGIDGKAGQRTLSLCHSMATNWQSGNSIQVECAAFDRLLRDVHPTVNAVKMDIEGAEIPLLETLTPEMMSGVSKFFWSAHLMPVWRCHDSGASSGRRMRGIFATIHFNVATGYLKT